MNTNTFTTLIAADALRALVSKPSPPTILEASFDLVDTAAGERIYEAGHIPGALYVHLERDLSGHATGHNGRHPLPERPAFTQTVASLGIAPQSQVVIYDRQGGMYAARAWWMLRWLGHEGVAVLDGGFAAWVDAGGETSTRKERATAAPAYPQSPTRVESVDAAAVASQIGRDGMTVLDARAADRFRGDSEPLDRVAGHIPGALNRPFVQNLDNGRFKPAAQLRDEFAALLGGRQAGQIVHSCGSGVTACHNLLAMAHAGLAGSRLYPGSWSEWSSDPARPVARG